MLALSSFRSDPTPATRRIITAIVGLGVVGRSVRAEAFYHAGPLGHLMTLAFFVLGALAIWITWRIDLRKAVLGVVLCDVAALGFGALDMQLILSSRTSVNAWFATEYAAHPEIAGPLLDVRRRLLVGSARN